jgi:predicted flavoprotein YhiN
MIAFVVGAGVLRVIALATRGSRVLATAHDSSATKAIARFGGGRTNV